MMIRRSTKKGTMMIERVMVKGCVIREIKGGYERKGTYTRTDRQIHTYIYVQIDRCLL